MGPVHQQLFDAVAEIAQPLGANVSFENGRKHAFIVVSFPETFRKITISHGTKTIKHQLDWARQNARRALREMGRLSPERTDA
jgi:hypothetical protein